MAAYYDYVNKILNELSNTLLGISELEVSQLIDLILETNSVFLIGVGRVQLSLLAFCKRLNHLGIKAYPVGSINEPRFSPNDLLIVGSRSGQTVFPLNIAKKAKDIGGKVAYIGSSKEGYLPENADITLFIPTYGMNTNDPKYISQQIMSSLFEQALLILGDIICLMIIERGNLDIKRINESHANLE